jgi:hypothetical protein
LWAFRAPIESDTARWAPDKRRDTYLETGPQVVDYLDRRSERSD